MVDVTLHLITKHMVCSQIITGFFALSKTGRINLHFDFANDCIDKEFNQYPLLGLLAEIDGKKIIYDMMDGFQDLDCMQHYLQQSDYYFKRSYNSDDCLNYFGEELAHKMLPLGLNYFVTCQNNPIREPKMKELAKIFTLRTPIRCFTQTAYECPPEKKEKDFLKVLYWARLWEPLDQYSEQINADRNAVNQARIETIRKLNKEFPRQFIGGLLDTKYARTIAPDILFNKKYNDKGAYLKLVKQIDLGIATSGLHQSIGWKVGEYVAASKGIVCEKMHHSVPGPFAEGQNYEVFSSPDECVQQVSFLLDNPDALYEMKRSNYEYYNNYVRPDQLVFNSLKAAGVM